MNFLRSLVSPRGAVFLLLIVLLAAVIVLNPNFAEPGQLTRFIQRVAPIAIVAITTAGMPVESSHQAGKA